jgi:hypothetical protein
VRALPFLVARVCSLHPCQLQRSCIAAQRLLAKYPAHNYSRCAGQPRTNELFFLPLTIVSSQKELLRNMLSDSSAPVNTSVCTIYYVTCHGGALWTVGHLNLHHHLLMYMPGTLNPQAQAEPVPIQLNCCSQVAYCITQTTPEMKVIFMRKTNKNPQ